MRFWCVALIMTLAFASGCRTAPTSSEEEERRQILAALEERERQLESAVLARDAELMAREYGWDAYVLRSEVPALRKADLLEFFQVHLEGNPSMEFHPEYLDVASSLDMAYEVGTLVEERDWGEARIRVRMKYLNVWKKVGGEWVLSAEALVRDVVGPERIEPDGARPDSVPSAGDTLPDTVRSGTGN